MLMRFVPQMRGQAERVDECTSANFDGMIAVMKPEESWVARWQRIGRCFCSSQANDGVEKKQPGLYAVRVIGRPPEDVIEAIEQRHGVFRSRDMEDDS
jgi:transcription elongation factor SPT4